VIHLSIPLFIFLLIVLSGWVYFFSTGGLAGPALKPRPRGAMVALQVGTFIIKGGYVLS
jgi:hypothetical protein